LKPRRRRRKLRRKQKPLLKLRRKLLRTINSLMVKLVPRRDMMSLPPKPRNS